MRISDWSSDVCSSDLAEAAVAQAETQARRLATEVERLERERGALDTDSDSAARLAGAERATAGLTRDIARWALELADRKRVEEGKRLSLRVDLGGRRTTKQQKRKHKQASSDRQ